jgi:hypothetical protein
MECQRSATHSDAFGNLDQFDQFEQFAAFDGLPVYKKATNEAAKEGREAEMKAVCVLQKHQVQLGNLAAVVPVIFPKAEGYFRSRHESLLDTRLTMIAVLDAAAQLNHASTKLKQAESAQLKFETLCHQRLDSMAKVLNTGPEQRIIDDLELKLNNRRRGETQTITPE